MMKSVFQKFALVIIIISAIILFITNLHFHLNDTPRAQTKHPLILVWTKFFGDKFIPSAEFGTHTCAHMCEFSSNRSLVQHADAVVFHLRDLAVNVSDVPSRRRSQQKWVYWTLESPYNEPLLKNVKVLKQFDWSMTYRLDSDIPFLQVYIGNSLNEILDNSTFMLPVEKKNELAPLVWVSSRCSTSNRRTKYVEGLMNYIKVDSYGACLNNKKFPGNVDFPMRWADDGFRKILAKYKFMLAIENSNCDYYVTEKLWNAFRVGSVPVYMGAPQIDEFLPSEKSIIKIKDFKTPKQLAEYLKLLDQNNTLYEEYLSWKKDVRNIRPEFLKRFGRVEWSGFCGLCKLLVEGSQKPRNPLKEHTCP
jgi:hypothetical protein